MPLNSGPSPPIPAGKSRFKRHSQISESHCGPAVIQMMLEAVDGEFSQEEITIAADAAKTIERKGTRIDQLARAVNVLKPDCQLLFQENSTLHDVELLIHALEIPVAVEWQGVFEDPEDEGGDYGHYSLVSQIDIVKKILVIVDPYKDFIDQDRIFTFAQFEKRWWDSNEYLDELGKPHYLVDRKLLFIVVKKIQKLPSNLHLVPGLNFKKI